MDLKTAGQTRSVTKFNTWVYKAVFITRRAKRCIQPIPTRPCLRAHLVLWKSFSHPQGLLQRVTRAHCDNSNSIHDLCIHHREEDSKLYKLHNDNPEVLGNFSNGINHDQVLEGSARLIKCDNMRRTVQTKNEMLKASLFFSFLQWRKCFVVNTKSNPTRKEEHNQIMGVRITWLALVMQESFSKWKT